MKPIRFLQPRGLGCGAVAASLLASLLLSIPCAASDFTRDAYIKASNTDPTDRFGDAIALSGNTLVVGAIGEDPRLGEGALLGTGSVVAKSVTPLWVMTATRCMKLRSSRMLPGQRWDTKRWRVSGLSPGVGCPGAS